MYNRSMFIIYALTIGLLGSHCSKFSRPIMNNKTNQEETTLSIESTTPGATTEQEVICAICLEPLNEEKEVTTLNCSKVKHQFHTKCIIRDVEKSNEDAQCRSCKDNITDKELNGKQGNAAKLLKELQVENFSIANYDTAKQLIMQLSDVNIIDKNGWTPLHHAADRGLVKIAEILIGYGANIEAQNNQRWTPLHCAADRGLVKIAEILIGYGAHIEAQNSQCWTPLHCAANEDFVKIAEILIGYGANIEAQNSQRWTPLHCAACTQNVSEENALKMVQLLIKSKAKIDSPNDWNWTPLQLAVQGKYTSVARLLIDHDADVNNEAFVIRPNWNKHTPLHTAICNKQLTMTKLLINNGANINAQDSDGLTPLDHAILNRSDDIEHLLTSMDAEVNIPNPHHDTLTHFIIRNHDGKDLELLLQNIEQEELNIQNDELQTPLHVAATIKKKKAIDLLMEAGADSAIRDKNDKSSFYLIIKHLNINKTK